MRRRLRRVNPLVALQNGGEGLLMNGLALDPLYFASGFQQVRAFVESLPRDGFALVDLPRDQTPLWDLLRTVGIVAGPEDVAPSPPAIPRPEPAAEARELMLLVAQACNQRCVYCFAEDGRYGAPQRRLMTAATARRALECAIASVADGGSLNVVFFGGEPLLNWRLVRTLPAMAMEVKERSGKAVTINFSISTNLTRLPRDFIDTARRWNLGMLVNIDGDRRRHLAQRPLANGRNSYDSTVRNVAYCIAAGVPVQLRTTVTSGNVAELPAIAKRHRILGADQAIFVPVVPMTAGGRPLDPAWYPDLEVFTAACRQIVAEGTWDAETLNPINELYFRVPERTPVRSPCGLCQHSYLVVDAAGDVYPCPYLVGDDRYRIGNVDDGLRLDKESVLAPLVDIEQQDDCRECGWRYLCAGRCPLRRLMPRGGEPDAMLDYWRRSCCDVSRELLEWSLWDMARKGWRLKTGGEIPAPRGASAGRSPIRC